MNFSSNSGNSDSGTLPIVDNDSGNPHQFDWWINRILEITQTLQRDIQLIEQNPAKGLAQLWVLTVGGLISDEFGHVIEVFQAFPQLTALVATLPAAGVAGGFAGLAGLAGIQLDAAPAVAAAPLPQTPSLPAVTSSPPVVSGAAAAPAPPRLPASAPATASAAAPAGAPPPPTGVAGAAYPYVVGGPTVGGRTGMSSGAQRKAPEPDSAAAAAAVSASAREAQRARRRRRATVKDRYRGYEFMDLEPDNGAEPDPFAEPLTYSAASVASGRPAGTLGFAGTARRDADIGAAGLATLAGDEFGGGTVQSRWSLGPGKPTSRNSVKGTEAEHPPTRTVQPVRLPILLMTMIFSSLLRGEARRARIAKTP